MLAGWDAGGLAGLETGKRENGDKGRRAEGRGQKAKRRSEKRGNGALSAETREAWEQGGKGAGEQRAEDRRRKAA
jgi:hypothetical protein